MKRLASGRPVVLSSEAEISHPPIDLSAERPVLPVHESVPVHAHGVILPSSLFSIALVVSLVLHAVMGLVLVEQKTETFEQPPTLLSIEVALVPPPAQDPAAEPQEAEPPAPEEKAEEAPEPEPARQEQAEQTPPPPEPEAQAPSEPPPAQPAEQAPVLQPVFAFGDEDQAGPELTKGTAPEDVAREDEDTQLQDAGQTAEAAVSENAADETASEVAEGEAAKAEGAEPVEVAALSPDEQEASDEALSSGTDPQSTLEPDPSPGQGDLEARLSQARPTQKPAPSERPARQNQPTATREASRVGGSTSGSAGVPPLARARELFSNQILGDTRSQTAMRGMGPAQRLNLLCMTELDAQLRSFDPGRPPEMLPSFRPSGGTVLEPAQAAYRSRGVWYDLAFRCEADDEIRKVQAFSFRVGPPIRPAQWAERGLPSF